MSDPNPNFSKNEAVAAKQRQIEFVEQHSRLLLYNSSRLRTQCFKMVVNVSFFMIASLKSAMVVFLTLVTNRIF